MKFEKYDVCGMNFGKEFYEEFEVKNESGEFEKLRNKKMKRYIMKRVIEELKDILKDGESFELVKIVKVDSERWCILEVIKDNDVVRNLIVKVSFE